jgi:DNA-binding PadR family transcriptional regulator
MKTNVAVTSFIEETCEVKTKLVKSLLNIIVLKFLETRPMHGYRIITSIRKNLGVYFSPSTIYSLLSILEKRQCVQGYWDVTSNKPKKIYCVTPKGQTLLGLNENVLDGICRKLGLRQNTLTEYCEYGNIVEVETINKISSSPSKVRRRRTHEYSST